MSSLPIRIRHSQEGRTEKELIRLEEREQIYRLTRSHRRRRIGVQPISSDVDGRRRAERTEAMDNTRFTIEAKGTRR